MANVTELNGTYAVDPAHTQLAFVTRHAMITKVRGTFTATGEATLDGANPAASGITVTADVASVNTGNSGRDDHLRSADFFDAEQFPAMTFTSTGVEVVADDEIEVTGDLTIKDTTRSVTIPFDYEGTATDPFGNQRAGFEGTTAIKRSDFGLSWNAALETGGVLVSEKVTLEIEVSAIKSA